VLITITPVRIIAVASIWRGAGQPPSGWSNATGTIPLIEEEMKAEHHQRTGLQPPEEQS
jgi:hypothetical protein